MDEDYFAYDRATIRTGKNFRLGFSEEGQHFAFILEDDEGKEIGFAFKSEVARKIGTQLLLLSDEIDAKRRN